MIEVVEELIGSVQDTETLNTSLDEVDTLVGELDSVGNVLKEQDINFYDYTGDLLYSYKRNDFLALTEMPSPIAHDKLVSQGWNWDLADAKTYVQRNGVLDIGEVYDVDNKGVIMGIILKNPDNLYVNVSATPRGNEEDDNVHEVYIDWGDGSEISIIPDGYSGDGHNYSAVGEYEIRAYASENTTFFVNFKQTKILKYVHIGSSFYIPNEYPFELEYQHFLEYITMPNYLFTNIITDTFKQCNDLKALIIPKGVEVINTSDRCDNLRHLILSNTITNISASSYPLMSRLCIPSSCKGCNLFIANYMDLYLPNNMEFLNLYFQNGSSNTINCPTIVSSYFSLYLIETFSDYLSLPETATIIEPEEGEEDPVLAVHLYNNYIGETLHIPSWITNIGKILYLYDYNLQKIYFTEHTQVPVLESSSDLTISRSCYIIVPDALYNEWCNATNWTPYAYRRQIKKASEMS